MQKRIVTLALIAVMVVSVGVIAANIASAQADVNAPATLELVGTIGAVNDTSITINGHVITFTGAQLKTPLTVGAVVKVEAVLDANGNISATEVKPLAADERQPNEIELKGAISTIDGGTFTVAGLTFDVSSAQIEGNLQVGDQVEVKLTVVNGVVVATKVEPDNSLDDNGNDLGNENNDDFSNDLFGNDTLGNEDNDLGSDDNEVLDNENNDDLGNDVNDDNGNDPGNDNDLPGNDDVGEDARLTGTLEQVGDGFIVINGQQINVQNAHIEASLIVGATVSVEVRVVNGVLTASEVNNANGNNGQGGNNQGISLNSGPGNRNDCGAAIPDGWSGYRVRSGDTLSSIAGQSGASADDIASANCIDNPNRIRTGQTIVIPNGTVLNASNDNRGNSGRGNGNDDFFAGNNDDLGNDNFDDHGGQGNDDGVNHDLNDDHGDNSGPGGSDDGGNSGSDDGANHDSGDDHGGNSGSGGGSDDGGSHDSGDDHGGNSGSGSSGSGHSGGSDDGGHGGDD